MKKILMTRLSICSLGVSCNEMIDTPMLLVVMSDLFCFTIYRDVQGFLNLYLMLMYVG